MKKTIRLISAVLAVIMVFSSISVACAQDGSALPAENTAVTLLNTTRGGINTDDYNTSEDEAAAEIRDALVKRQNPVVTTLVTDYRLSHDDYQRLFARAYSMDLARNSSEGDYLRWSFRSYSVEARAATYDSKTFYYTLSMNVDYLTTLEQENEVNAFVADALKSLNLNTMQDYEKVIAIGNFICEINNYDYDHYQDASYGPQFAAYGAVKNGVSVCQGYCALFYKMCLEAGIPCRIIASTNHTWNLVKLTDYGDYYYNIDITWNDTAYDDMEAADGNYWSNTYVHDYSLKSNADFKLSDHTRAYEFATAEFEREYPVAPVSYYLYEKIPGTKTHKVFCADCKGLVAESEACTIVDSRCIYCEPLPSKPSNIRTTARGGTGERLKIEWNAVSNADGYNVYILQNGEYVLAGSTEKTEYVFENLVPGWEYYFRVAAYSGDPENEGPMSGVFHTCAACPPMDAPSVNAVNSKTIQVDWTITNAHGYVVQWSTDPEFKTGVNSAYVVGHNSDSYAISVPNNAQGYYVRVRAWRYWENNTLVYGIWTGSVKHGQAPVKVTGLYTSARGGYGERLKISWDAQAKADSYNVYRLVDGKYTLVGTSATNEYIFESLTPGWEYYYKVSAVRDGIEGILSDELHTCAACPPMSAPSVSRSGSQIKVNWGIVNSHGYVVMWSTDPSFKTNVNYAYVVGHEATSYTIKGLDSSKTYYVRTRAWRYWENNTLVYGIWTDGVKA